MRSGCHWVRMKRWQKSRRSWGSCPVTCLCGTFGTVTVQRGARFLGFLDTAQQLLPKQPFFTSLEGDPGKALTLTFVHEDLLSSLHCTVCVFTSLGDGGILGVLHSKLTKLSAINVVSLYSISATRSPF